ncbi:Uncharacterised protein [Shigella sonnei]|nr:Uncharacterised protein [Shigella sonnei]
MIDSNAKLRSIQMPFCSTEFFQPCSDLFTESGGIACRDGIGKAVKERGKGVGVLFMFKSMPYL